jgi:hypothetical protein
VSDVGICELHDGTAKSIRTGLRAELRRERRWLASHDQGLRAAEGDVGVEGELLAWRQPQVRVPAGQLAQGDLGL